MESSDGVESVAEDVAVASQESNGGRELPRELRKEARPKQGRLNNLDGKTWSKYSLSVWDIAKTTKEAKFRHPAMFPLELCKRLIETYTREDGLVVDPFAGSGSTLVAAHELGRRGVGVDVNLKYVELAKRRLSQTSLLDDREEVSVYLDSALNLLT